MAEHKGLKAAIDSILDRMYEHKVLSRYLSPQLVEEDKPHRVDPGMGFMRYLYREHNRKVAAELSKEIKHGLMQDMLRNGQHIIDYYKAKRPGQDMPSLGTRIVARAKPLWPGSEWGYADVELESKKFSKYFRITATFCNSPRKEQ